MTYPPSMPAYAGYRFPGEVISHAVWLYFRFPLGLRMVEEMLAARGIVVSHETVRQWARKFGQAFANQIRAGCLRLATSGTSMRSPSPSLARTGVSRGPPGRSATVAPAPPMGASTSE